MFVHAVPDNRGKSDEFFCSLVNSKRINGKSNHITVLRFGRIAEERLPYLKAAFNQGDPKQIFEAEVRRLENRKKKDSGHDSKSKERKD